MAKPTLVAGTGKIVPIANYIYTHRRSNATEITYPGCEITFDEYTVAVYNGFHQVTAVIRLAPGDSIFRKDRAN